jgi:hypothetical protein
MSLNWSKFDNEKFDGTTSFALWQVRIKSILSNLGVRVDIIGRPEELAGDENNKEWAVMDEKCLSTIQLCVNNSTLQEILTEITTTGA